MLPRGLTYLQTHFCKEPRLIGPFISAYVKVHGRREEAKEQVEAWVKTFHEYLSTAGLGQISEIADAECPHESRGCIAQAWSTAELLRAAVEDVYEIPLSYRAEKAAAKG